MGRKSMEPQAQQEVQMLMSLAELWQQPRWIEEGRCRGVETSYWFADDEDVSDSTRRFAVEYCETCPVRLQCLSFAVLNNEKHGVWGGSTRRHRRRLREMTSEHRPELLEPQCGTPDGWLRHYLNGESACPSCRPHRVSRRSSQVRLNLYPADLSSDAEATSDVVAPQQSMMSLFPSRS